MTEAQLTDERLLAGDTATEALHAEEHLAARCMFLKDYDLLDIDHGHFWYKVSWHGVHVEFPSPQHHYEANPYERQIRDYLLSLPVGDLERSFAALQDRHDYELVSGDHHFKFVWDEEVRPHLHCYYQRSEAGRKRDTEAYQSRLQEHARSYESDRQFPSKRLLQKLAWLREERSKAQQTVDAWQRLIVQVEEQIAHDQIVHTGKAAESLFAE
ncbi:MAG: hypothetical protein JWO59_806 [Chloroflexi bacterium]|nr:hypothetical protein [Chloroflexota bacterium]